PLSFLRASAHSYVERSAARSTLSRNVRDAGPVPSSFGAPPKKKALRVTALTKGAGDRVEPATSSLGIRSREPWQTSTARADRRFFRALGWAEGLDHLSLVSSVFRHLAGTTTSTAPSAVLGARNPDSERAHCVPPCVSGPSYRASIQLSDPTSLTAAFEKRTLARARHPPYHDGRSKKGAGRPSCS